MSWEIIDGLKARGSYSTSFVAPSLTSTGGAAGLSTESGVTYGAGAGGPVAVPAGYTNNGGGNSTTMTGFLRRRLCGGQRHQPGHRGGGPRRPHGSAGNRLVLFGRRRSGCGQVRRHAGRPHFHGHLLADQICRRGHLSGHVAGYPAGRAQQESDRQSLQCPGRSRAQFRRPCRGAAVRPGDLHPILCAAERVQPGMRTASISASIMSSAPPIWAISMSVWTEPTNCVSTSRAAAMAAPSSAI